MESNEKVLVVASDIIFEKNCWQGLKTENLDYYLDLIKNNYHFRLRKDVEGDPSWQQIIPYVLFSFEDRYFLYHYLKEAGEKRLKSKNDWILGVGGHINPIDTKIKENILEAGMMREWNEEVDYKGNLIEKKLVGIINDNARAVEAVHLGLVYHFKGHIPDISIKEKDKLKGGLIELNDLAGYMKNANGWAPIVYDQYLSKLL